MAVSKADDVDLQEPSGRPGLQQVPAVEPGDARPLHQMPGRNPLLVSAMLLLYGKVKGQKDNCIVSVIKKNSSKCFR